VKNFLLKSPFVLLCCFVFLSQALSQAQTQATNTDKARGREMLAMIKQDLIKNYYDPAIRGMDVEARFKIADDKIKEAATPGQILGIIGQVLIELDDSHTFFLPPSRVNKTDYGWTMQVVGDRCFVTAVAPGSDAEAKGVKPGDEVIQAGGYAIDRKNHWKFQYLYNALRPQPFIKVVLQAPGGERRELNLAAKIIPGKQQVNLTDYNELQKIVRNSETDERIGKDRFKNFGKDLLIWKMNEFDLPDLKTDEALEKARDHKTMILDLRGNGGGYESNMLRLVGSLFDHDVKVADVKTRKETKLVTAKSRGEKSFTGKLVVLIDSNSGSAAEMLARVVQIEKRGTIMGDQSAGAVMRARHYQREVGLDVVVFYGASITVSEVIMSDGQSIEHVGVTPDKVVLPTGADLAANRDVVLSQAAALLGVELTSEEAGKLFPKKWRSPW